MVETGIDRVEDFSDIFKEKRIGLIVNQASVNSHYISTLEVFQNLNLNIKALFGPQHGLFGHTQDNMIEWHGNEYPTEDITIYSLYGENRKPTPEMLADLDLLVFDVPDIGARYYTFIWTMALSMQACLENNIEYVVLDRPNPINGVSIEGPLLNMDFRSFVGLFPLPIRHGMTTGEIAGWLQKKFFPDLKLQIVNMGGWNRDQYFDHCGLPWVMPSPNMPSLNTALVYPGQCLLEATNISEGRGTTRPFEIFGAPWIDGKALCQYLNQNCAGAFFQQWYFQPAFHKFANQLCQGVFIHISDRSLYRPVATTMTIISYLINAYPNHFSFKKPPYEYEFEKQPIDILLGSDLWQKELNKGAKPVSYWEDLWRNDEEKWQSERQDFLLY